MIYQLTYNALTRQHFECAAQAGLLTGPSTRRGVAGTRAAGTWVQFDAQFEPPSDRYGNVALVADAPARLRAVRFQAFGCPHVIAVADWVAEHGVGLPGGAGLPESLTALKRRFAVPTEKLGRLLVIEDAWIAAVSPPSVKDGQVGRATQCVSPGGA